MRFCLQNGIDYIDTSNERWEHGAIYNDSADFAQQWNILMDERKNLPKSATALASHGANPGIVSHFAKQAIENLAKEAGILDAGFNGPFDWPSLAQRLKIEALHISERDTQVPVQPPQEGEFFNTWSIEGLVEEGHSNPCFAWGSHEAQQDNVILREDPICLVATLPGYAKNCIIRSWLPGFKEFEAAIIPHEEAFSIAELLTDQDAGYQPTVMFSYRPCDVAFNTLHSAEEGFEEMNCRVLIDEVKSGTDELGILVLRRGTRDVYWYGSNLGVDEARSLIPFSNATSLQVAAGVLGGLVWILENPGQGLVAAEDTDHARVLEVATPYLGSLKGVHGHWENAPDEWHTRDLLIQ